MHYLNLQSKNVILDDIHPTMSALITEEQFKTLCDYATEKSYNALVIDPTNGNPIVFKNWKYFKYSLIILWHHCVIPFY